MAKKHRTRARPRRSVEAGRRPTTRPAGEGPRDAPRATYRTGRGLSRTGYSRAVGTPSSTLERAAALERAFVVKDFKRIGIVSALALALLAASGFVVNLSLR